MALGVAAGAFGAHGLREQVSPEMLAVWKTGASYHMLHALALVLLGAGLQDRISRPQLCGWLFTVGILLFAGSLYLLTLTGHGWLGAITPLGGLCFISAWMVMALSA
jgi:uncharacterized membrane protein YgdD (TMEM256/DUF423 family)